ncbi:TISDA protein, partial [Polyodon spathula]|nr:TISDA protein [Polyodon spathula]
MNTLTLNSMLEKQPVAIAASTPSSTNCASYTPGFIRPNSSSNLQTLVNSSKYPNNSYNNSKETTTSSGSATTTAQMNKENRFRDRSFSENGERSQQLEAQIQQQKAGSHINSTRYKTELCRPFEESGACKYGEKCQFAHGYHELRSLSRHPKYKTEPCRTFHTIGFCPYGPRCHFIHNADERRPAPCNANSAVQGLALQANELCGYIQRDGMQSFSQRDRPKLHHSLSFSGFSSHHGPESPLVESPTSRTPPPPSTSSSSSSSSSSTLYEDMLSPSSLSCANNAFSFPRQELRNLLAPLAIQTHSSAYYTNHHANLCPPSPPCNVSHLQSLRRLSESPVFDSPPSPPDSLSDRESYASGSRSSSGSLSGSESPSLESGKRLPIFSRLSVSDD